MEPVLSAFLQEYTLEGEQSNRIVIAQNKASKKIFVYLYFGGKHQSRFQN